MKVHRWQPSGKTPCGRNIADVQTNIGYYLSDGVTCESCHKATTFLSIMGDDWNGQSYGYLPGAARDLWEADLDGNCPSKSELGAYGTEPMKVLSLGWGIQSFTLAAMVALGELGPIDAAIHADTTHEANGTYEFARQWTPWLEMRGVRVVTVANLTQRAMIDRGGGVRVPAYTITEAGNGQVHRQCTGEWKISPIRRWLQANRSRRPVELWIGISLDEYQRMKDSDVKYISHRWPLIERRMNRNDCKAWLGRHGLLIPPKSACVFCPYHDTRTWHDMKAAGNGDWHKAVEIDERIRKAYPPYDLFLHPSRKPLAEVDFRNAEERGQLNLWNEECSGICGV